MKIPRTYSDITTSWLSSALQSSNVLGAARVTDCRIQPIGAEFGFASQIARVELTFEPGEHSVPSSIIVKLAASNDDTQRCEVLSEKNRCETSFYQHIGPQIGVRIPRCYFVDFDETSTDCVLLLEDLQTARFGDAAAGCAPADAQCVIDTLATLHARWWNNPQLDELDWLPRFGKIDERLDEFPMRRTAFLSRHGDLLPEDIREFTLRIGPQCRDMLRRVGGLPETLLHVDTHLDNIAFLETDGSVEAVLFDWQGVSKGLCTVDLALFLSGALMGDDRSHEQRLLERYHDRIVAAGVEGYPLGQLHNDYRVGLLRWWIGTIGGLGSDYAATWTGRQASMARQAVAHWCTIIRERDLASLV